MHGLGWYGIFTDEPDSMKTFVEGALQGHLVHQSEDFWVFDFERDARMEVFGPKGPRPDHLRYLVGGVMGFSVPDIEAAKRRVVQQGGRLLGDTQASGEYQWQHFSAPDGRVYELTYDPRHKDHFTAQWSKTDGFGWYGIFTDDPDRMKTFVEGALQADLVYHTQDFWVFLLANGDQVEVFGLKGPRPDHLLAYTGGVVGFLVPDIEAAKQRVVQQGGRLLGDTQVSGDYQWQHFSVQGQAFSLTHDARARLA